MQCYCAVIHEVQILITISLYYNTIQLQEYKVRWRVTCKMCSEITFILLSNNIILCIGLYLHVQCYVSDHTVTAATEQSTLLQQPVRVFSIVKYM
jgi:hypothetical protein